MGFILPHHHAWHSCSFPLGAFVTLASFLSIPICPCPRRGSEGIAVSSFIFVNVIDCTIHLMGLLAPDVLVIPVLFPPSRRSTLSRWCASCILSGCYTFSYTLCVLYFARIFVPFALRLVLPELSLLLLALAAQLLPGPVAPLLPVSPAEWLLSSVPRLPASADRLPGCDAWLHAAIAWLLVCIAWLPTSVAGPPTTGVARLPTSGVDTMSFAGPPYAASLAVGAPSLSETSPAHCRTGRSFCRVPSQRCACKVNISSAIEPIHSSVSAMVGGNSRQIFPLHQIFHPFRYFFSPPM
jgi:hypothetical protein